ncbi:hypothetical protein LU290_00220 [Moraxella nasibovis]|uniref:hypothetical protein n=1 Tax=Moraxella nasibovis TaxID=2904120 RepID=UPI00240F0198|nr:hypothetical protein [Moraxella nasibovis]WFF38710.1 hypothetical protein LU290_00220 [Moraxella nasibovis]
MTTNTHDELSVDFDDLDFDAMLGDLADVTVEGGFDSETAVDDCEGGACKI